MNAFVNVSGSAHTSMTLAKADVITPLEYDISRVTYLLGRALTNLFQKLG